MSNNNMPHKNPSPPHTPEDAPSTRLNEPPPVPRRPAPHGPSNYPSSNLPSNMEDISPGNESPSAGQSSSSNRGRGHRRGGNDSDSSLRKHASNGRK